MRIMRRMSAHWLWFLLCLAFFEIIFLLAISFPNGNKQHGLPMLNKQINVSTEKNWYFSGGTHYPEKRKVMTNIFVPNDYDDRIEAQLMTIPEGYQGYEEQEKLILAYNWLDDWGKPAGNGAFYGCPVNRCSLSNERIRVVDADAVIYKCYYLLPKPYVRPAHQVWLYSCQESPDFTAVRKQSDVFNWTATYRRDSTLVTPYDKWMYYDSKVRQKVQNKNYALHKTKKIAWFVSNCNAHNDRLAYARELAKHMPVDMYGYCGKLRCSRGTEACLAKLDSDYKFYLSFENSNCVDYITEKLYVNALRHNILPIVMGARPQDFVRSFGICSTLISIKKYIKKLK